MYSIYIPIEIHSSPSNTTIQTMNYNIPLRELNNFLVLTGGIENPENKYIVKAWRLLRDKNKILSAPTPFQLLITTLPNVKGYVDLVFETSTDIKTPEELLQYLNSIDVYLMKRFPQTYKPYLREDPDWNLLSLLINKLERDGIEPFVVTVKDQAMYSLHDLCYTYHAPEYM